MPTYRYRGANRHSYNGVRFYEGVDKPVDFYIPEGNPNFEKISDDPPAQSDILFAGIVSDAAVDIPRKIFKGEGYPGELPVTVSATASGAATIRLAGDVQGVEIDAATGFCLHTIWGRAAKITVIGTAKVQVERRR